MITTTNTLFAEVALALPLDRLFHYAVPQDMLEIIGPGMRVEVPFGTKNIVGYVAALHNSSPVENVKNLSALIDTKPAISEELFSLARWISVQYACSLGEALSAILPSNLREPKRAMSESASQTPHLLAHRHVLNPGQQDAVNKILESINAHNHGVFLVHGVTSSGKTEVYLSCAEESIRRGRSVIFLLPEISLTPQFISIVQKRFPGLVGIWHSQISAGQRYRTWDAARQGKIKIMLGARSALFAPFKNPGLIIVDEEHEPTYKQDQKPSYQARDVARERARINNACLILGSATPSLESYYRAKNGEYNLIELHERIDARMMPPVKLVESRHMGRESKVLSSALMSSLERVLARREQAIIFLNRRGFAPSIVCHDCGQIWQCPRCAISLVYHREPEGLHCHYCGYSQLWPGKCNNCNSTNIAIFGVGTQKVEQELMRLFPQGRTIRLDRDTASKKGVYEKAYDDFKKENFDILVGTQMVAKGFDFPRVTLVGVVDADTALYLPDFRSAERTFQLITQVAGRSGRSRLGGEVIVQTRHNTHYALIAAQKHDYKEFYDKELEFRRQLNYPPFCRLVNIILRARKEEKVTEVSQAMAKELQKWKEDNNQSMEILGPSPAAHPKIRNLFRWQILLKGDMAVLHSAIRQIKNYPMRGGVLMHIDVDPQETI